jgi:acetyl/propionyl-CoA carboxylase alpha subunit
MDLNIVALGALYLISKKLDKSSSYKAPWDTLDGFRINSKSEKSQQFFSCNDRKDSLNALVTRKRNNYTVTITDHSGNITSFEKCIIHSCCTLEIVATIGTCRYTARVVEDNNTMHIFSNGKKHELFVPLVNSGETDIDSGDSALVAPMPCKISQVNVKEGNFVTKGQTLLVLEAMKMEVIQSLMIACNQVS